MAQIPLNKFVRKFKVISDYASNPEPLYICPSQRATIVLTVQAANLTQKSATFTLGVSAANETTLYYLVSGFVVPRNDSANVALGKVLITAGDALIAYTDMDTSSGIHASFSLLEAFNET